MLLIEKRMKWKTKNNLKITIDKLLFFLYKKLYYSLLVVILKVFQIIHFNIKKFIYLKFYFVNLVII